MPCHSYHWRGWGCLVTLTIGGMGMPCHSNHWGDGDALPLLPLEGGWGCLVTLPIGGMGMPYHWGMGMPCHANQGRIYRGFFGFLRTPLACSQLEGSCEPCMGFPSPTYSSWSAQVALKSNAADSTVNRTLHSSLSIKMGVAGQNFRPRAKCDTKEPPFPIF